MGYVPNLDSICHALSSFTIFYTSIDSRDLCDILRHVHQLHRFHLCTSFSNNIPTIWEYVVKVSHNLTELHLNDGLLPHIKQSLKVFRKLKHLSIVSHTSIYDEVNIDGQQLKTFACSIPKTLRELNILCNWKFFPEDFGEFLENCQANLKYLYLGFCSTIGDEHVKVLEEFLNKRHEVLTKYYIPNKNISKYVKRSSNHFYCRLIAPNTSVDLCECGYANYNFPES